MTGPSHMPPPPDAPVELRQVDTVDLADFIHLYRSAGWWHGDYDGNTDFVAALVKGSACFVAAFDGPRMVGMARALSDGCSDAYVQDVTVLPWYRGRGIGSALVRFVVAKLRERGVDWIGLVGEPGSTAFYERLGFEELPSHRPMRLRL